MFLFVDPAKEHGGERAARDMADLQVHKTGAQSETRQSSFTSAQVSASDTQVKRIQRSRIHIIP